MGDTGQEAQCGEGTVVTLTSCSETWGLSRRKPCGVGRGTPAWSRSVGRAGRDGVTPGQRGEGTGWGQHSLFAQGTPKSHSPNLSSVSSLVTCGTGSP